MFLERRTVSRKTPNDGKLEITKRAAEKFSDLPGPFDVDVSGERSTASIGTMECTCRGADNPHVHYFIQSPAFQRLSVGDEVDVERELDHVLIRVVRAK
jgi:hypothetical protein